MITNTAATIDQLKQATLELERKLLQPIEELREEEEAEKIKDRATIAAHCRIYNV